MEGRISNCFISLLFFLAAALPVAAQQNYTSQGQDSRPVATKKEKKKPEVVYPLFNGVSVSTDLWGPGSKLLGGDFLSAEVMVDVDLKHRYFPTVEIYSQVRRFRIAVFGGRAVRGRAFSASPCGSRRDGLGGI